MVRSIAKLTVLASLLVLAACGGDGGGSSEAPPPTTSLAPLADSNDLNITVNKVTISSPSIVDFTVTNENKVGVALAPENMGSFRFALAKLKPGSNGDADHWEPYIYRIETANSTVGPDGKAAMASAKQGTAETGTAGTLQNMGGGRYQYTLKINVTDPAQTQGTTYESGLTHRLAMQVDVTNKASKRITKNPYLDFVPTGIPVTKTKNVVNVDSCNTCHDRLAIHGGGRIDTKYCVACHNPSTTDANSGNNLNFAVMVHKIHRGEHLSKPYIIWGNSNSKHDYSEVTYPQDLRNCTKCHDGANPLTPDGDNWKNRPTKEACGACHDKVDFNNHPTAGFVQKDNATCAECHVPYSSVLRQAVVNAHTITAQVEAKKFKFNINNVNYDAANRKLTVTISVTDPINGNRRYDIQKDAPFTVAGGASRMGISVGWDAVDFKNTGRNLAQPISLNPLFGGATNNGDNTFTMSTTLPAEANGTGIVAIDGHPAVNTLRIPVPNVVQYFAITGTVQPRRQVVSIDKCNECHDNLSLHGNNRQGTTEVCVICHNPNATDMAQRPATADVNADGVYDDFAATGIDGKREESIHFKTMIHSIHASKAPTGFREKGYVAYGFGRNPINFSGTTFPGLLTNCQTCHINNSFRLPLAPGVLGTTVQTADASVPHASRVAALASAEDDLNISPMAAACYACHDTSRAKDHMVFVGNAVFDKTQVVINGSVVEVCDACHGAGEFKDVAVVHSVHEKP